jgi:hypothetical protein
VDLDEPIEIGLARNAMKVRVRHTGPEKWFLLRPAW